MSKYSLSHLTDGALLRDLVTLVSQDRATTAALLAHLAEFDARQLYLPAAYPSMHAYCVGELSMSDDAAYRRIGAARAARQFPAILPMLAHGRLHLTGVLLLAPHLTRANAAELLGAAAGKRKAEIEALLAERFPRSERLPLVVALPAAPPRRDDPLAPERAGTCSSGEPQLAPERVASAASRLKVAPIAAQRFALQLTVGQSTYDKLEYARALLGHTIPSGEIAQVIDRALDALIGQLERRKFAATTRPRPQGGVASPRRRTNANPRHIPAHVRRAVWERDGGQCTFTSASGKRCPARSRLEYDHVEPVARGGRATVSGTRLRCRAHNQYAAECTFSAGFMSRKREAARSSRAARAQVGAEDAALVAERAREVAAAERAREVAAVAEVVPWLRALGFRADEARRAAARCETIPDAPLEQRVRAALCGFAKPRHALPPGA